MSERKIVLEFGGLSYIYKWLKRKKGFPVVAFKVIAYLNVVNFYLRFIHF